MAGKKAAKGPGGRPTDYKDAYTDQARKLCRLGAKNVELAEFFEVSDTTIQNWMGAHPEFMAAIKEGREFADVHVAESLYHRATGYEHDAVKIFMPANAADPVYAPYRERYAPDTAAAIFWLKNRRPDLWRDRQHTELTGKDGGPIQVEGAGVSAMLASTKAKATDAT